MPSTLPDGEPAPRDGALPPEALAELPDRPFGIYVHVPFCAVRCGYCDFNTYTPHELGARPGASLATYAHAAVEEIRLARRVLGDREVVVDTVFFGGGTPTMLPAADLVSVLAVIGAEFGLTPGAEVTTEANPDSVTAEDLEVLRRGGINRISFGMQSAEPSVLAVLDRTHDPLRVPQVVACARWAGFDQVSLDLIYGTPGESRQAWRHSVESAVALEPDHVSAYALIVEEGTALARHIARGEVDAPDDDDQADKYELVDDLLTASGYRWYEVSNWARDDKAVSSHNLGYWRGDNWWGVGPGAHSHVGGVRWWNVKHPTAYAQRLISKQSPAAARELLTSPTRRVERVMLEIRLAGGLPLDVLDEAGRTAVPGLVERGLLRHDDGADRLILTRRGRLLVDPVVHALLP
ncbi:MAG: radical SAM family heme chaperone HemW [Nocardioidaceae bacterium]